MDGAARGGNINVYDTNSLLPGHYGVSIRHISFSNDLFASRRLTKYGNIRFHRRQKAVSLEGVEVDVGSLGGKGQHRLVFLKRILRVKIVRIRWHDLEVWRVL